MTTGFTPLSAKLNWLRAGVLGANDGIVSTAGIVMGVAGATSSSAALLVAGLAGLVAGALSMAGGEYVSVSSQKDAEIAAVGQVRDLLDTDPDQALADLATLYQKRGLSESLARQVAQSYTGHDAVAAQTEARFGISAHEHTSPWTAALASFASFTVGALIPLLVMVCTPPTARVLATIGAVIVALALTGSVAAWLGASQAASATPMAGLRQAGAARPGIGLVRVGLGVVLLVGGAVAIFWGLRDTVQEWYVGAGVAAGVIGLVLIGSVVMVVLARPLAGLLRLLSALSARLAKTHILANPRRAANLAGVFVVTLSLASAMLILAASATAAGRDTAEAGMKAEFVLVPNKASGTISGSIVSLVASQAPSTVICNSFGQVPARVMLAGDSEESPSAGDVMYAPMETFTQLTAAGVVEGEPAAFANSAAVSQAYARAHDLHLGDTINFLLAEGTPYFLRNSLPVGLIVDTTVFGDVIVPTGWVAGLLNDHARSSLMPATMVFVTVTDTSDLNQVEASIAATVEKYRSITVMTKDEFVAAGVESTTQAWVVVYALAAVCVLVAVLAIVNVFGAAVAERTREIGLLKALGASDGQVARSIRFEAVIIAVVGSLLGIGLGVGLAFVGQRVLTGFGLSSLSLPWVWLAGLFVLAVLTGVVAAALPARRAARMPVMSALAYQA